ncbi:C-1-tetrahydrofolate synthase, cytoplasmic isoform X2 [Brachyhypopomus gauderio]|uniref:C-1-tetrahydrofolate synthase, cytoplasmic isoform X2 n=1 Tax=Brachyhypopomus gauderio TaxID=698409 RepID=UPI004041D049
MFGSAAVNVGCGLRRCRNVTRTIATVISGNKTSQQVRERLRRDVAEMKRRLPGFSPGLVVVQVGDREDSNLYISMKLKAAAQIGLHANLVRLPKTATEDEVLRCIAAVNENPEVHGLIVQLPLDSVHPIDTEKVTNAVAPEKDVDGLSSVNAGKLARGDLRDCFLPCTPSGCMELIATTGVSVAGRNAVVVGRSKIVGAPMHDLLLWNHATVTCCHSKTPDLAAHVGRADILVVGAGKAEMVRGDWIKEGAVVIDCGINHIPDSSRPSGTRVVGDVHYQSAKERAKFITPVPGGVGPMTVAMLMENTVKSAQQFLKNYRTGNWSVSCKKVKSQKPQPSDTQISHSWPGKPIGQLAKEVGLFPTEVELYGTGRAKVSLGVLKRLDKRPDGKYVVVTGIAPSPLGEGHSTTVLGLAQALGAHMNVSTIACVGQTSSPSSVGIRGGAVGGGYSQVIPIEEVILQPLGDSHAVSTASSLVLDTITAYSLYQCENSEVLFDLLVPLTGGHQTFSPSQLKRLQKLDIVKSDPSTLTNEERRRFVQLDINLKTKADRAVLEGEIRAVLSLSTSPQDLRHRLAKMVVADSQSGEPITIDDLGVSAVLALLLNRALKPCLMQTLEGTPAFLHMAHCSPSVMADKIALKLVGSQGFVVTDTAHGADVGLERFFNITCRSSGLQPDVVVLVATVRALKMHGGGPQIRAGFPLPVQYSQENLTLLVKGCSHLKKQVDNAMIHGLPVIVAVNTFSSDTEAELELVCNQARQAGVFDAVQCTNWSDGGAGALALAQSVQRAAETRRPFRFLYDLQMPITEKVEKVAQTMYGAKDVELSPKAKDKLDLYIKQGFGSFPVRIAKTHFSLSHDPKMKGVPTDFVLPVADIQANVGAGVLCVLVDTDCPEDPVWPWLRDSNDLYSNSH